MTAYSAGYIVGSILGAAFGMGLFIFAIVAIVKAFTKKTTGWIVTACVCGLMMLGMLGLAIAGVVAGIAAGVNKAGTSSLTRQIVSKDGRYSFDVPPIWKEMPQLNAEASLAAGYGLREQYMMLIVDSRKDFSGSLNDFSKLVTERIGQKMKGAVLGESQSLTVNGHPALRKRITGSTQNINLVYLHTSVELPDSYCQILCWTLESRESTAFPIYERVIQTFKTQDRMMPNPSAAAK
jgi:hypothetical protein